MVELELWAEMTGGAWEWTTTTWVVRYRCHYVVQARVDGLEDRLKAELKAVRKSFLRREVVDFRWEGKELAKTLNSDASLKNLLYPADRLALLNKGLIRLSSVEINIVPYGKHQCIRMSQKGGTFHPPADAFPTVETFDAFDRIAQHIRSIANVRP